LSDETAISSFGSSLFAKGSWSHQGIDAHLGGGRGQRQARDVEHLTGCVLYSIDDFLERASFVPLPTHLKIDVDGPDLKVLRGAANTLAKSRIRHILVELFNEMEEAEAETFLRPYGFVLVSGRVRGFGNRFFERKS
jgi:hypothetical protein